jgi:hypothetical protein
MIVGRKTTVVNPHGIRAPNARSSVSAANPAWLLTLGPMNPHKRSNMAGTKKNRASGHHKARSAHHHKRRHRHSHNPFAKSISLSKPTDMVIAGLGVLVGVTATKTVIGFLPDFFKQNTLYATIGAFVAAGLEWWLFSMVNAEFGAAAGLGGIAQAGSIALTNYFPTVGGKIALSGRGVGDFVSGRFAVPQNPVLDGATALPLKQVQMVGAYSKPYGVAA